MTNKLLTLSASLLVSGCVGIGPIITKTKTVAVAESPPTWMCPDLRKVGELEYCGSDKVQRFTKEQVLSSWGEPKARGVKEGREFLTYNSGIAWRGLIIAIIVPIPLLLPLGHDETTLFFENEKLVLIVRDYGKSYFAGCGYWSTQTGFSCGTEI